MDKGMEGGKDNLESLSGEDGHKTNGQNTSEEGKEMEDTNRSDVSTNAPDEMLPLEKVKLAPLDHQQDVELVTGWL